MYDCYAWNMFSVDQCQRYPAISSYMMLQLNASLLCSNIHLSEFCNNKVKSNGNIWSIKDTHEPINKN